MVQLFGRRGSRVCCASGKLWGAGAQCAHRLDSFVWRVPERLRVWSRGVGGSNDARLVFVVVVKVARADW
jgi:hypothetical protein